MASLAFLFSSSILATHSLILVEEVARLSVEVCVDEVFQKEEVRVSLSIFHQLNSTLLQC